VRKEALLENEIGLVYSQQGAGAAALYSHFCGIVDSSRCLSTTATVPNPN